MVFYFESAGKNINIKYSLVVDPPAILYMDEELIRWGWPEDIWFHVDDLSSAHVYLRLKDGQTMDDIEDVLLQDCCQLVKANSNKINNLDVIYTQWKNLLKTGDMVAGQVGFKNQKDVRKSVVEKRDNAIINRLNKTKTEREMVDYRKEREERDQAERLKLREEQYRIKERSKAEESEKRAREEIRSYATLMKTENMQTNTNSSNLEEDFM